MDDEGKMVQRLLAHMREMWRILADEYAVLAKLADTVARAAPRGSEEARQARALRDAARYRTERIEKMLREMEQEDAREEQKERFRVVMGRLGEEEES